MRARPGHRHAYPRRDPIVSTDKYLALRESASRTERMFAAIYPEVAMKFGDDPRFKKLVIAITDLRSDLRSAHTPTGDDPWAEPSSTTLRIADE